MTKGGNERMEKEQIVAMAVAAIAEETQTDASAIRVTSVLDDTASHLI